MVVGADGSLLGFGNGNPPFWCSTAASAEAWALQIVAGMNAFLPKMITDCQALLATASSGKEAATAGCRQLARVWAAIASFADGDLARLVDEGLLVWMPAHQASTAIGVRRKSNQTLLTSLDWRANRLADALAKLAAQQISECP